MSPSPERVVAAGRRASLRTLVDTCRITRAGEGRGPFDPATGTYAPPARTTVYEGPCRVRATDTTVVGDVDAGEQQLGIVRRSVRLPVDTATEAIRRDDLVEILTSLNPGLVGQAFTVRAPYDDSLGTLRRVPVEKVV